jgi:hypothetical protein
VRAVAVLSGAEWPPMPGRFFAGSPVPMLFTQGSADTINPPWTSLQLYQTDNGSLRHYLDFFGATHLVPYAGDNSMERLVDDPGRQHQLRRPCQRGASCRHRHLPSDA